MESLIGRKILIVEDDAPTRGFMADYFEANHCIAEVVEDGKEALKKFDTFQPDLVLLDIGLPGMDGRQVLKALLKKDSGAKVVMTTADTSQENIEGCIKDGALAYVIKPLDLEKLLMVIEDHL